MTERRWKLTIEYNGLPYVGWQQQPNGPSVHSELTAALSAFYGRPVLNLTGSGRTDAGVHARGQVASFTTSVYRSAHSVRSGVNHHLSDEIQVVLAEEVPLAFHPRHWAFEKHYRYRWLVRDAHSPLRRGQVYVIRGPLALSKMSEAGASLVGSHDFSSFRASGCGAAHPNRTIRRLSLTAHHDEVHLDIYGHGFLRHMVRIIAGSLTQVGLSKQNPRWLQRVLLSKDRQSAGPTAPAHGLTLMAVHYGDGPPTWIEP